MNNNNSADGKTEESLEENENSGNTTGFENFKNIIADKLLHVAEALYENAANQDARSSMAQYEKQASEWLDQSAEYVRQFDYEQADARLRECIGQSPGRSLLIAGGIGLVIGAMFRRR